MGTSHCERVIWVYPEADLTPQIHVDIICATCVRNTQRKTERGSFLG